MKTKDSVVLVTGANRGLGLALARAALEAGARRVYATARNPAELAELARTAPDRVRTLALDVTDAGSVARAAAEAPDVGLLFNNAGVLATERVLTTPLERMAQEFATNFYGVVTVTRAFLPALERAAASGGAAVVNVLSVVALASAPSIGAYSASKAAAFSLTQSLRGDLAKRGIRVHGAFPGAMDTDMTRGMDIKKTSPDAVAASILQGVERDLENIAPDPFSQVALATWLENPNQLEKEFIRTLG